MLDVTAPAVQRMADAAEQFAGKWFKNRPHPSLLIFAGQSGTGKSHTARRLNTFTAQASLSSFESGAWQKPLRIPGSVFLRWPETCDGFKEGNYGVIQDCFEAELLFLDDVGAEHDPSKNGTDKLCQILSRREQRFTVITTNIVPQAWETRFDKRIVDRLLRNSAIVDLADTASYQLA